MFGDLVVPQPLSSTYRNAAVYIGNVGSGFPSPPKERPALAVLAAEVIASWSNVEAFMMRLFIDLMGGPADLAARVYLALEAQSAKSAAINAAAEAKLTLKEREMLRAILALAKTHQKTRDKVAHWSWGISPQLPEALLLANPKDLIDDDYDRTNIYVYTARDFTDAIKANERLAGYGMNFRFMLTNRDPSTEGGQIYDQLYAELAAIPEIQERMGRPPS
jgi:hypothetical protein